MEKCLTLSDKNCV